MPWTPAITLTPREPPLPAVAVVARGPALAGLSDATRRALAGGAELRAAAADDWLVVVGAFDALPWADGCVYLGRDGPLLIPTTTAISPPADLVAAAITTPSRRADPSAPAAGDRAASSSGPPAGDSPGALSAPSRGAGALVVVLDDGVLVGPRPLRPLDPEQLP